MTTNEVELQIPRVPVTVNDAPGAHWRKKHRRKRELEDELATALMLVAGAVRRDNAHVHATASLRFPQRRRRDEGNFRAPLEKALGDALQARGVIPDDTPRYFTFGALVIEEETGPHRTTIKLEINKEATNG